LHFIDEGPKDAKIVFLCLHGQPTWSYLYRKMIPIFVNAGYRAIAPDYYGFGKSDKPIEEKVYTFEFHRNMLIKFIKEIDLHNICLVCQDWGGLLGLTLPMDMNERFSRLLIMNTALGLGNISNAKGFLAWRKWNNEHPDLDPGRLLGRACPHLTEEEKAAYSAPFPDITYKAGVRTFPNLVPDRLDSPGAKISQRAKDYLQNWWDGDSFMAIGMQDPVLDAPIMRVLRKFIKGCPKPLRLREAGHFVQEWGDIVAKKALEHFNLN
jgi:haloalkane dehalogenase